MRPRAPVGVLVGALAGARVPTPADCTSGRTISSDRPQTSSRRIASAQPAIPLLVLGDPGALRVGPDEVAVADAPSPGPAAGAAAWPSRASRSSNVGGRVSWTARRPPRAWGGSRASARLGSQRDDQLLARRPAAGLHGPRRRTAADRAAARPAVLPAHARGARARAGRARAPRGHARPARARRVRPPAREVALLDAGVRRRRWSRCSTISTSRRRSCSGTSLGANVALEAAVARAGAGARDGDRDAGARPRADRLRDRVHADHGRADRGRARRCGRSRARRGRSRGGGCRGRPTSCSTGCARTRSRAPPCSRACSSGAPRRRARSAARCRRRRS